MSAARRAISVVIPAFNEEQRVVATLQRLIAVADTYGLAELMVVDDGSVDRTAEFVARVASQAPRGVSVRLERLAENSGKGAALRAGASIACGELILFLDADLAVAPPQSRPGPRLRRGRISSSAAASATTALISAARSRSLAGSPAGSSQRCGGAWSVCPSATRSAHSS